MGTVVQSVASTVIAEAGTVRPRAAMSIEVDTTIVLVMVVVAAEGADGATKEIFAMVEGPVVGDHHRRGAAKGVPGTHHHATGETVALLRAFLLAVHGPHRGAAATLMEKVSMDGARALIVVARSVIEDFTGPGQESEKRQAAEAAVGTEAGAAAQTPKRLPRCVPRLRARRGSFCGGASSSRVTMEHRQCSAVTRCRVPQRARPQAESVSLKWNRVSNLPSTAAGATQRARVSQRAKRPRLRQMRVAWFRLLP
jgi:hypothetical protein